MTEPNHNEYQKYFKDMLDTCLQHTQPVYHISNLNIHLHSKDTKEQDVESSNSEHTVLNAPSTEPIPKVKQCVSSVLEILETEIKSLSHPVMYDKKKDKYDIILTQDKPYRISSDVIENNSSGGDQSSIGSDNSLISEQIIRPLTIQERFTDD